MRALLTASATRLLTALIPEPHGEEGLSQIRIKQRRRSALCSMFSACLELGKQGGRKLTRTDSFGPIEMAPIARTETTDVPLTRSQMWFRPRSPLIGHIGEIGTRQRWYSLYGRRSQIAP
jgi:hypothetical protein